MPEQGRCRLFSFGVGRARRAPCSWKCRPPGNGHPRALVLELAFDDSARGIQSSNGSHNPGHPPGLAHRLVNTRRQRAVSAFPRGRRIRAPTNRAVCRSTVSVQVPGRLSVCHDPSEQTVSMCRRGATRAKDREGDDAMSSPSPLSSRRTDEHRPKNSVALDGVADAFGMRAGRSATKNGSLCRFNFDTGSSWVRIAAVVLPQCPCRRELRGGCKRAIGPIAT